MTPTCEHEGCANAATYMGEGGIYLCDVPHYSPRPSLWHRLISRILDALGNPYAASRVMHFPLDEDDQ